MADIKIDKNMVLYKDTILRAVYATACNKKVTGSSHFIRLPERVIFYPIDGGDEVKDSWLVDQLKSQGLYSGLMEYCKTKSLQAFNDSFKKQFLKEVEVVVEKSTQTWEEWNEIEDE